MKVVCHRVRLEEAFAIASMVVPLRTTVPALTNVRLTATRGEGGGTLELACTDFEFGLRYRVPAVEVGEEGTLVLPAGRMSGIVRASGEETLAIDSDGPLAHLRMPGADFKVVGLDPADFPVMPEFDEQAAFRVSTQDLGDMIRKTQFAVSTEVVRYALTGQLFEVRGQELRMVASDGKRLAYAKGRATSREGHKDVRVIAPTKTMSLLEKVLHEEDDTVALQVEETQVRMKTSRAVIFSRLIEGNFPDYESVVPTGLDKKLTLACEPFLEAVRRVALMTSEKSRAVKFMAEPGRLVLFTRTPEVGEARVEVPMDYAGAPVEVVFNPDYVVDYLKVVPHDSVELHLKDKSSAAVFRAGHDYVYVLMPLSVAV